MGTTERRHRPLLLGAAAVAAFAAPRAGVGTARSVTVPLLVFLPAPALLPLPLPV